MPDFSARDFSARDFSTRDFFTRELAAWVGLSLLRHVGGKTMRNLLAHFQGDLNAVLAADQKALQRVPGIGPKIAAAIQEINLQDVESSLKAWHAAGVQIITLRDAAYPDQLRDLDDAPPTLFVLSNHPFNLPEKSVAIVGTRQPSRKAVDFTHEIAYELSDQSIGIVSGLALGIDSAAHVGVAANPKGWPVAVLGSGVLNVYPPENVGHSKVVTWCGSLICEVAPNATVSASGLVARNRIITGLADAVVIVETASDGGAMHAARFAQQQGRPIYVVDLPASGNRQLIQNGAIAVSSADQLFEYLKIDPPKPLHLI